MLNTLRKTRYYLNYKLVITFFFSVVILCAVNFGLKGQAKNLYFENYSIDNGLSNNVVHCIMQDSRGWMWFGTSQGLNRFDGYKFTAYRNNPDDNKSLMSDLVRSIFEDKKGNLWIGTENGGLHLYNRETNNFTRYSEISKGGALSNNSIFVITEDSFGNLWIGTENGLNKIDCNTGKIKIYIHHDDDANSLGNNLVRALHIDKKGKLWIGTFNGFDMLDPSTDKFEHYRVPGKNVSDNEIWRIFEDTDSKLWIGTYTGGTAIFDPVTKQLKPLVLDPGNKRGQTVRAILKDKHGDYWIGTRGGLYIYSKETGQATRFQGDDRESSGLCHSSILDIVQDTKGDIWIGTRGGISYLINERQTFKHYRAIHGDNEYLNNSEVYAFWIDPQQNIWVGTENGGINILDRKTGTFRYMTRDNSSLSNNCIKALLDDHQGNLWIGTYMGGINVYNLASKKFSYYEHRPDDYNSLISNKVWSIFRDSKAKIWIGTEEGLDCFDNGKFKHYQNTITSKPVNWINEDSEHDLWIGARDEVIIYHAGTDKVERFSERTRGFCEDAGKHIWLATQEKGLALYDKKKGPLKYYKEANGIANNLTFTVTEVNAHELWISTANGLSKFNPLTEKFKNYNEEDGLQSNQFNYGAFYKSNSGELLYGGINGFTMFDPIKVKENQYIPPIVFTDFRIFNQPVPISSGRNAILKKSITECKEIVLPYNQNVITFEFAALNYARSNKNMYKFILQGFEKNWNNAGHLRSVTYTNLNPGNYVLTVKASNNDNKWNEKGISLSIRILPPWWKTWWFKLLVVCMLLGIVFSLIAFFSARVKLKHELSFEREKAQKLHELDLMKLKFFTNISHEIRTPLTLIIGPIEKIMNSNMPADMVKSYMPVMHRNANQLLKLINQLLDFRKLESGNLKLELSKGDLNSFVKEVVGSFSDMAEDKGVKLKFNTVKNEIFIWFDPDKIEKIINNLVSNAIKFTERDGQVSVNISLVLDDTDEQPANGPAENKFVEIVVKDTGIGIQESNLEKIFLRFFQAPETKNQAGTGIGLALTKELVKLHKGQIFVESKPGKGTKFTVRLPYGSEPTPEKPSIEAEPDVPSVLSDPAEELQLPKGSLPSRIMLIVEDNHDVRFFIRTHFESDYQVVESVNGKEGWQLILNTIPDVVISDIMMPGIDGNELCKRIKKDERTSHIPVILLTALSSREGRLNGLDAGADDYITKPFDVAILRAKVENLLSTRRSLKEKYTGELVLKPKNIIISSPDERFLQKSIEIVEKYMSEPEFTIEQFASELGVSRMQLYRKMEALTDMTVKEFIRNIRLKRATQLLVQGTMNVSEVAFNVGFNDLSHFRKCFRQEFGMSASEYAEKYAK
jgi:signal transduction histidine kinase/ligand-binding sensor domain-containing protein/DNA-binding response OmpR family regulator